MGPAGLLGFLAGPITVIVAAPGLIGEARGSSLARCPDGTAMMVDTPRWSPSPAARYADRVRLEWLLPGRGGRQRLARELGPRPIDFSTIRWCVPIVPRSRCVSTAS
ncbi:hypothetical protein [Streptomyces cyaneus]|uniref:hypothetical protein n=1 Tax=Streptomyces cyaneus TaxID=1904 RepID=UPI000FF89BA4|nr:hypothetical protein [Streptomyces cyaneus]